MQISPYNSQKIKTLNFIAINLVIWLHNYYSEAESFSIAQHFQLLSGTNGITGVAVPLFFFMSGLLFFKNIQSVTDCINGIKKRIRTILVPFIIWNFVFVGWFAFMALIPTISQHVNSDVLSGINISHPMETLKYMFWQPAAFHLWFLRDLIIFFILSPVIYVCIKKIPWIFFIFLLVLFGGIHRFGLTYFALGGIIAVDYNLEKFSSFLSPTIVYICGFIFILGCINVSFPFVNCSYNHNYLYQITNICGIIFIWGGYDLCKHKDYSSNKIYHLITGYSFFIYVVHEPALNVIKKTGLMIFGSNELSLIVLYVMNPLIMTIVSLVLAIALKKCMPKTYSLLTGGR